MVKKMYKMLGKYSVICGVLFYCAVMDAGIRLEMRTADGVEDNIAAVGQPFVIEAIIDGVHGSVSAPHIEGLDAFFAKRTGMYMSSINGVSTTKYTYHVRIDQPGNYTIGPARLVHQQQEFLSNTLSVVIGNETVTQSGVKRSKNTKKADLKVFVRLMVDKDRVVVGQRIKGTLRFYYQDSDITLTHLGLSDMTGFDVKPMQKPVGGTTESNGVRYRYAEWIWEMYPTKSGEFVVPACSIDYEIPIKNNQMFGGFFMLMGARSDRKRAYSNAVKISVDPLPYSQVPLNAIGTFESIRAHISPPVAKEGEGMVLTIEVSGDGNMEAIHLSPLCLPNELKYYDSNVSIIDTCHDNECAKKKYEFVVQGMKCGDWQIPEQHFVYFDIDKHAYVTLKTSSLSVSIQPLPGKGLTVSEKKDNEEIKPHVDPEVKESIACVNDKGPWYPVREKEPFSWLFFYLTACAPLLYHGYPLMSSRLSRFALIKRRLKKRACKDIRKKIIASLHAHNDIQIYSLFMNLFAVLMDQPVSYVSRGTIELYLKSHDFSSEDIQQWDSFFVSLVQAAYTQSGKSNIQELYRMAIQWLERLERLI